MAPSEIVSVIKTAEAFRLGSFPSVPLFLPRFSPAFPVRPAFPVPLFPVGRSRINSLEIATILRGIYPIRAKIAWVCEAMIDILKRRGRRTWER